MVFSFVCLFYLVFLMWTNVSLDQVRILTVTLVAKKFEKQNEQFVGII